MEKNDDEATRRRLAQVIDREMGPFAPAHLDALIRVDRSKFVRPGDKAHAYDDAPLALDDEGLATISAPHAYLLSFRLVELAPSDHFVELGSGTGYGAALASEIVGADGRVTTIEISKALAERARTLLAGARNVTVVEADAIHSTRFWGGAGRVVCTFAVEAIPEAWLHALPRGGILVAPVGTLRGGQRLMRIVKTDDGAHATDHGAVRYVPNRGAAAAN
jgi:protein-L-isoaspartate(D-aspartate) O-methyltransferase